MDSEQEVLAPPEAVPLSDEARAMLRKRVEDAVLRVLEEKAEQVAQRLTRIAITSSLDNAASAAGKTILEFISPKASRTAMVQINNNAGNGPAIRSFMGLPEVYVEGGKIVKQLVAAAETADARVLTTPKKRRADAGRLRFRKDISSMLDETNNYLTPRQRQILVYLQNHTNVEAAEHFRINKRNIEGLVQRSREGNLKKLKKTHASSRPIQRVRFVAKEPPRDTPEAVTPPTPGPRQ